MRSGGGVSVLRELLRAAGTLSPPWALWYHHAGYKEVWDKHLEDPNCKKKISEYAEEAIAKGWWKGFDRPAKDCPPKVMFVSGSNPLRRHRGGMNTYFKTLWPKPDLVVMIRAGARRALLRLRAAGGFPRIRGRH
jgi:hypothetical protein